MERENAALAVGGGTGRKEGDGGTRTLRCAGGGGR